MAALNPHDAGDGGPTGAPARGGQAHQRPARKLAEQVALQIEDDVRSAGWPVGANLGSESDLIARYGVSRAVLREAVSLTEYLGVARMRRGPGGGLMVAEPDQSAVITAVMVYLTYREVRLEDILQVRGPVEDLAARLAAARRGRGDIEVLQARTGLEGSDPRRDHWVLHDLLAAATGNPALELIVNILGRFTDQYQGTSRLPPPARLERQSEILAAHQAIVKAIQAGDAELASRRMRRHLDAIGSFFSSRQLDRTFSIGDLPSGPDGEKLAALTARRIFADIVGMGWPVGQMLGSEPELMARYGVSRAVLREANRLLEFHRVLRTQRGVGGGIFVAEPDEMATTNALAVYLDSRGVTTAQLFEVREAIELTSVDLAASKLDKYAIGVLTETLVEEMSMPAPSIGTTAHALHVRIAELTGNHVIVLFLQALTMLTAHHLVHPGEGFPMTYEEAAASASRAHAAIVKAIAAGDAEAARRRMLRHLRALPPLLR